MSSLKVQSPGSLSFIFTYGYFFTQKSAKGVNSKVEKVSSYLMMPTFTTSVFFLMKINLQKKPQQT